jgi:tetratricopeptide (TPR) repeat protein
MAANLPVGEMDSAIEVYKQAFKLYEQASKIPPIDPNSRLVVARAVNRMGFVQACTTYRQGFQPGLITQAQANYDRSIELYEKLLAERPRDPEVRSWFADALGEWGMGFFLLGTNRAAQSEPHYRRAIDLCRGLTLDSDVGPWRMVSELEKMGRLTGLLGRLLVARGSSGEARELYRVLSATCATLASRHPDEDGLAKQIASPLNSVAWNLATDPDAGSRDPKQALEFARQALTIAPGEPAFWNTRGAAAYRDGDWKQASEAFEKSMNLNKGGDGNDWFFLAMVRWQQNNHGEARQWLDKAITWLNQNKPMNLEELNQLNRFRAEAELLMQASKPSPESKHSGKR